MIKLETLEFLRTFFAYIIAYFPTVAIAGYFESWLIYKLGDSTAKENGFLTLNPLKHLDILGIALMVIPPHFGFGARIPINIFNIQGRFKNLRVCLAFFARTVAHFLLLLFLLFSFVIIADFLIPYFNLGNLINFKSVSSSIYLILNALINLNILSVVLYFLSGVFRIILHFFFPDIKNQSGILSLVIILLVFVLIIVFFSIIDFKLRMFLNYLINYV